MTRDEKCAAILNGLERLSAQKVEEGKPYAAARLAGLAEYLGKQPSYLGEKLFDVIAEAATK